MTVKIHIPGSQKVLVKSLSDFYLLQGIFSCPGWEWHSEEVTGFHFGYPLCPWHLVTHPDRFKWLQDCPSQTWVYLHWRTEKNYYSLDCPWAIKEEGFHRQSRKFIMSHPFHKNDLHTTWHWCPYVKSKSWTSSETGTNVEMNSPRVGEMGCPKVLEKSWKRSNLGKEASEKPSFLGSKTWYICGHDGITPFTISCFHWRKGEEDLNMGERM